MRRAWSITRGEHGVVSVSDALRVQLGTYPVAFVDGSGGGDAFNAGYIAGLLEGRSELDCLKLASAVGASCVRAVGTTAGVFTRAEAEAFLSQHRTGRRTLLISFSTRARTSAGEPLVTAHRFRPTTMVLRYQG